MEFGKINQARVVLGGVANKPWRLLKTEELLRGRELTPELINSAAESAVEGAQPLAHNHYKIALVKGIVKEAFAKINKLAE
jgi:xanthine dehydrogenase YagS FAD-binding subunit